MVTQMKTFAMALDLVDEPRSIMEYREYHRNVWPEVKEGLLEIGIDGMEIISWVIGCLWSSILKMTLT